jgi:competence protein ComFC
MFIPRLAEIIAPKACRSCSLPGSYICVKCLRIGIIPRERACYRCYWGTSRGQLCIGCEFYSCLAGTSVVARYEGVIRDLILSLKNHNDVWAAEVVGSMIARAVLSTRTGFDLVTAVPTSPQRYHERGYNPAEHIAKVVARQLELPYRPLLLRLTATHQIGVNRQQRLKQIKGAFYLPMPRKASGCSILVVDDVLTTGATLEEVARVLRDAGARLVWGAAVARH